MREFSRVQDQALSLDSFDPIQSFPECGGIDIFIGTVRNHHEGKAVKALKYTSYTPVAEKMIREIEQQIKEKHQVSYVRVIHRIGYLDVSETAIIAADIALKASGVEIGFVDRFSGTLITTGTVSQVEEGIRAVMEYCKEKLMFTICEITKT